MAPGELEVGQDPTRGVSSIEGGKRAWTNKEVRPLPRERSLFSEVLKKVLLTEGHELRAEFGEPSVASSPLLLPKDLNNICLLGL